MDRANRLTARALEELARHPQHRRHVASILKKALGWKKLPKGWTQDSVKKFWDGLTGDAKHKVTKCMKKMEPHMGDAGGFCASIKDMVEGTTSWRGKDR